jgi:predicted dehydrogenase
MLADLGRIAREQGDPGMSARKRRIGVIGLGFGAQVYIPAFQSEGWEVLAVCARHREKAEKVAASVNVRDVHTDPLELIARSDLDAIAIATPPRTHHPLAIAALNAGKHVLCEKPFALDEKEAAQMRDAANASGLTAMVGHEFRHAPQRAYIKQLLNDGYIGRFELCTLELFLDRYVTREPRERTWLASEAEGGGILGALGSHYIDALRNWLGEVTTVTGQLQGLRPEVKDPATGNVVRSETDDTFLFRLGFANGGTATMIASFAATPARGARIAIMGDRGTLMADQPGPNPVDAGVVIGSRDGTPLAQLPMPPRYTPFTDDRDPRLACFRLLVRDFSRGIDEATSPSPNFADGWRCQQVMDAVRRSSREGRTVTND